MFLDLRGGTGSDERDCALRARIEAQTQGAARPRSTLQV
jgi:hypothetical protein